MGVISKENIALDQTRREFKEFYDVDLVIEESALRGLAAVGIEIDLGVRGLNTVLNSALRPFYKKASELLKEDKSTKAMTVTIEDIKPAIKKFADDNKETRPEFPESIRYIYGEGDEGTTPPVFLCPPYRLKMGLTRESTKK